ncbi:HAD-IC family P-type ATPase [Rathayibacter sp. VKM Ac-2803]|uniref:cation-translocating P-type ATPase n=1 Tax=unclassified Rathayibacter TaxID=2609250 RepID=UPI0013598E1F|nr:MULTISPECIES: HAD-IC family P-type ATPase [unclassified Rathayibacter]MWV49645.1 HAD-IC family P-type ATPase [Rathayibacter sp. VKM Ac-2803]MWV59778.1 HAD-IC family P-type ATPase [Rathayibacter sp. VKM Ac-2754]
MASLSLAPPAWETAAHARTAEEVLTELGASEGGLSATDAAQRLTEHGPNALPAQRRPNAVLTFLRQFHDILIYVLLASAIVTFVVGDGIDAIVILSVTVINAIVGVVQDGRTQRALDGIRAMLSLSAKAKRQGAWVNIDAADLVTGDVVRVEPGDRIPADARLLGASTLRVDESALTGESLPTEKSTAPVPAASGIGDRTDMVFSGTHVTAGDGTAVITATGLDTEIGRIHALVTGTKSTTTPLTRQLDSFSRRISLLIIAVAGVMLLVGRLLHDRELAELVPATIGFAVAAIPEGLPALITITLALGVRQMASHHAIVRKLTAVETLGSVTTICTDKTGTLTRNEMTVRTVVTGSGSHHVAGTGYAPEGAITPAGESELDALIEAFALCNDAHLVDGEGGWQIVGDPTEGALRTLARKGGFDDDGAERLAVVPFAAETKYMATRTRVAEGTTRILLKGAPGVVLEHCSHELRADGGTAPLDRARWARIVDELGARGLRVLAAARSHATAEPTTLGESEFDSGLVFLGVAGILDPPRPEAVAAIARMHAAGIRVKMITGDHAGTALAIAREMGIAEADSAVLTGDAVEAMTDEQLAEAAPIVDVYARTSPEHKLRIVAALQSRGEVVAMTGDGVNDAPALRRADIGVAMGIKGTETTKEAADIVLADDDFATIGHAVKEGRRIRDNLQKSILFLLPTTSAQALVLLLAVLIGFTLPLQATQILWVNLITAITLSLALATEPAEPGIMRRPPTRPGRGILDRSYVGRIVWVTALITAATIGVFFFEIGAGASSAQAQTTAVTMLTLGQLAFLFSCRFLRASSLRLAVLRGNRAVWISGATLLLLQLVFVYAPFMHPWFHSAPLGVREWAYTAVIAAAILLLTEAGKAVERGLLARRAVGPA